MKSKVFLFAALCVSMLFIFSACGDDNGNGGVTGLPDVYDGDYEWLIMINDNQNWAVKSDEYMVTALWLGEYGESPSGEGFKVSFAGESYEMNGFMGSYFSSVPLASGTEYEFEFSNDEDVICSSTIRSPYRAEIEFPDPFVPTQSTDLEWTMDADNDYQYFEAYSENDGYKKGDDDEDEEEGYFLMLDPGARSLTIPANAVEEVGTYGYYSLSLMQMNFYPKNACAISCLSVASNLDVYEENDVAPSRHLSLVRELGLLD